MKWILSGLILVSSVTSFAASATVTATAEKRAPAASPNEVKKGDYVCVGQDEKGNTFQTPGAFVGYMNFLCDRSKPFDIAREESGGRNLFHFCCVRK